MASSPDPNPAIQAFRQWQEQSRILEQLQIVFVVGPPKCGTTWLQKMLGEHPESVANGEGRFGTVLVPLMQEALAKYQDAHMTRAKENQKAGVPAHLELPEHDRLFILRQALDRCFIRYLANAKKARGATVRALVDKTPDHARCIIPLATIYPWAKFVCISRDVRDAAVSSWFHRELLGVHRFDDINRLAVAFAHDVWGPNMWAARAAARLLPADRYTEVTYEELKGDTPAHLSRLFRFIGLEADEQIIHQCVSKGDFAKITGREPGVEAKSFHRKGIVGDWVNHLTQDAARQCVATAQAVLDRPMPTRSAA